MPHVYIILVHLFIQYVGSVVVIHLQSFFLVIPDSSSKLTNIIVTLQQ